jgi:membrane protein
VVEYAEKLHLGRWVAPVHFLWNFMRYSFGCLFLVTAVALLYHFGPSLKQRWRWITPGSVVFIVGFGVCSAAFSFYVGHFGSYDKTYGSLGAVIILLFWMYLLAAFLLLGAEVNALLERMDYERDEAERLALATEGSGEPAARGGAPL